MEFLKRIRKLFPACAGVIPFKPEKAERMYAFPRVCGGDPRTQS